MANMLFNTECVYLQLTDNPKDSLNYKDWIQLKLRERNAKILSQEGLVTHIVFLDGEDAIQFLNDVSKNNDCEILEAIPRLYPRKSEVADLSNTPINKV